MVVDTSALVAILLEEPGFVQYVDALVAGDDPIISAGTLVECSIVMRQRDESEGLGRLDDLLAQAGIRCVAVDMAHVIAARGAWERYGKGRHPAGLNFGDCFSYALATTADRPLLYKGEDFARTDVRAVLAP